MLSPFNLYHRRCSYEMISKWLMANKPSLLVGGSLVGIVALGAVSFYSGLKCSKILDEYKNDENLTSKEKAAGFVKDSWPYLIPPTLLAIADCGMVLGAHNELVKRAGIATALMAAASTKTADLKKQMREDLGETASERIEKKALAEEIAREGPPQNVQVTGHGDTVVRNQIGGRDFYACYAHLLKSIQIASEMCRNDGVITVNTFFNILGIDGIDVGDVVGWYDEDLEDGQLPVKITSLVDDRYEAILAISTYRIHSLEY